MNPLEHFSDDVDTLIRLWLSKPEDDQITCAEMVGVLEVKKSMLIGAMLSSSKGEKDE